MPDVSLTRRAYSLLEIKSVDDEARVITGIATTPETDRMGDVVMSEGAEFKLPIPLLWQHDSHQPIGEVFAAKVTSKGIEIKARIATITEPGTLKDRLDEAWQSIKTKLVRGLSIGFQSIEFSVIKETGGLRFLKWLWLELSAVTIPANADANIQTIKSCDTGQPAATGIGSRVVHLSSALDATRASVRKDSRMKTIADKIAAFKADHDAKIAKLTELEASCEGSTFDAAQQDDFDTLTSEVTAIEGHLKRLDTLATLNKGQAQPIAAETIQRGSESRVPRITVTDRLEKGQRFARFAMCVASAKGSMSDALHIAQMHYPDDSGIHGLIKAAVTTGTTSDGGGPILQYQDILSDFIDYLRPGSILGKFGQGGIPDLNRVGFNVRVTSQTAAGSGYWVGQGKPKPMTKATFSTITVDFAKCANIAVLTKEEVRFVPSSEMRVRNELTKAINARIDQDLIDPANAGSANVKPAAITYNLVAVPASGTNAAAVQTDFSALMTAVYATPNLEATSPVLIMSKTTAINLSLMLTSLGQPQYPNLTMNGGNLFGIPVIVSEYLKSLGSPGTNMIVLVDANEIYLADDGNVSISASDQASLEMLDSSLVQDATAGTGTSLVSLWQSNLLGLLAEREISWKLRRSGVGVGYISNVAYAA